MCYRNKCVGNNVLSCIVLEKDALMLTQCHFLHSVESIKLKLPMCLIKVVMLIHFDSLHAAFSPPSLTIASASSLRGDYLSSSQKFSPHLSCACSLPVCYTRNQRLMPFWLTQKYTVQVWSLCHRSLEVITFTKNPSRDNVWLSSGALYPLFT